MELAPTLVVSKKEATKKIEDRRNLEILELAESPSLLLEMRLKIDNIVTASISPNGTFIACSDMKSTHLFRLSYSEDNKVQVEKRNLVMAAAHRLTFTPDSASLIVAEANFAVRVVDAETCSIQHTFTEFQEATGTEVVLF